MGVTTGQSASTRLFPFWSRELGLGDVRLVGCDLPLHAPPERYREVVRRIRDSALERGGLVTSHKVDLLAACRDLFDGIDPVAALCGETSCLAKRDGALWAFATDTISSGRALAEFYPFSDGAEVLCIGAGGSAVAITVHLLQQGPPSRITVAGRSAARLSTLETIHSRLGSVVPVRYVENSDPDVTDRLLGELPPGSLVINATGMGKDVPGSPISHDALFPEQGYVWELNYRGELDFLHQARQQQASRHLHVEDGWRYFIHGWAVVMERVFEIEIDRSKLGRLAAVSESERPRSLE